MRKILIIPAQFSFVLFECGPYYSKCKLKKKVNENNQFT